MAKKFYHMFDVGLAVETPIENYLAVPATDLIAALERRLQYLKNNPNKVIEAFVYSDSYEVD